MTTKYIADDGTEFDSSTKCREYEEKTKLHKEVSQKEINISFADFLIIFSMIEKHLRERY